MKNIETKINNRLVIHFYNTLCSEQKFHYLLKNYNIASSNAAQKFFNLLVKGLVQNNGVDVTVNSVLPINSIDQKRIFWSQKSEYENDIKYTYVPLLNLPIIRNLFVSLTVFVKAFINPYNQGNEDVIVVDYLRFSINIGIYLAAKIRGKKVLAIVTDRPGYDVLSHSIYLSLRNKLYFLLNYDYYVCLTKELDKVINTRKRPSIVIEGWVDSTLPTSNNSIEFKYKEFVIVYAGSLYEKYGLKNLIQAFKLLPQSDLRLWFFGVGPFEKMIIKESAIDFRIQFKGAIPNSELLTVLYKATLLINPRPTSDEYTKYSFPSKNLEYMASGTPLLTTKLHGIPKDHFPYIHFIEDDSEEGIFKGIHKMLEKGRVELHSFGLKAKEFTLREKNNKKQAGRIIDLLRSNIEDF